MPIQDPHSFADTRQGRIRHIDFDLTVDFESRTLSGTGVYAIEAPVAGSLFLDTRGIHVERVFSEDHDLKWSIDEEDRVKGRRLHIKNSGCAIEDHHCVYDIARSDGVGVVGA